MFKPTLFILLVITFISCHNPKPQPKAMVVVHGGAGYVSTDLMIPGEEEGIREAIKKSLQKANSIWQMEVLALKRCELQLIF